MNDITSELAKLHILTGADFVRQLKLIVAEGGFHPVEGEAGIFSVGGDQGEDYDNLLNAARKAVTHGFSVYMLPNPKGIRTADFVFVRKGVYRLFDLKTIVGKNSVGNRLKESIGQTDRVLLNLQYDYNVRNLTTEIRRYFEISASAQEVLVFTGNKVISIKRNIASSRGFFKMMMNSLRK